MGRVPNVESVFFPLDEELGLLPGSLAPRQQEHLTHLACFMPFNKAVQMMEVLLSVQINEETARRLTERMGVCMQVAQTAAVEPESAPEPTDQPPLQQCVLSADGAMVSLVKKQWAEVRTLAIGVPKAVPCVDGGQEIHVGQLSYFSRLADATSFIDQVGVEMRRRKVGEAKQVCAVMDGADWLQSLTERYRPDAVRILDFPHAAEHLSQLLEAFQQAGMHFPAQMLQRCLHILKHRGPRPLLRMADRHLGSTIQREGTGTHLGYLRHREALMQYPLFRQQGWPLGSGMVESANKTVVQARLKGTGMHWQRCHVNPMLALRTAVCNDRWEEMWQKALKQQQQAHRQKTQREQQAQTFPTDHPDILCSPAATWPGSSPPAPRRPRIARLHRKVLHRKEHTSSQIKSEVSLKTCICGTPIVQSKGLGRIRHYCSDRCRVRAHRKLGATWISSLVERCGEQQ